MSERTQLIVKLICTHVLLIIGLIIISVYLENDAFLSLLISQTVLLIVFLTGYWEFLGLKFKNMFFIFSEFLILLVFFRKLSNGFHFNINLLLVSLLSIVQLYLVLQLIKIIIVINEKNTLSIDINFPFKDGRYLITDGGNSKTSRLMNYHYYSPTHIKNKTNNSMLYAVDIIKLKNNNPKFFPKRNEDYPIFTETVCSPIKGIVIKVQNTIPDNEPYSGNYPYNTGNTIVIRNEDYYLLLGHLKKDSIKVKEGDNVNVSDDIAEAGNSGWTERPHLHMQLIKSESINYWFGKGINIRYQNKNVYKNRLINMS